MLALWIATGLLVIFLILSRKLHTRANLQAACDHSFHFDGFSEYTADWGIGGSYPFLTITWRCEHCKKKLEGETAYAFDVPDDEEQRLYELPSMTHWEVRRYQWPYEYERMNP